MVLQGSHLVGIGLVFLAISAAGIFAARKVKSADDFSIGGRSASAKLVAGTLMGTMVGGAATIGTAQVAFSYGLSAWWFTLGAGIAFVLLASGMGKRLYEASTDTIPQVLAQNYGNRISPIVAIFTSVGIYFSFVANTLAFVALCTSTLHISPISAAILGVVMVLVYVLFGGVWGTGLAGALKVVLVCVSLVCCGTIAYLRLGGAAGMAATFPVYPWFSLFGRGFGIDFASAFSMLLGVLSTQTYFQAITSARSLRAARQGALLSAVITPLIGIGGVLVGLYMHVAYPQTPSSQVLPAFALHILPPILAGIVLATLLVAIVGASAGLALGMSTMFTVDIYRQHLRPQAGEKELLLVQRLALIVACLLTLPFVNGNAGVLILDWTFLSMGLRGCTVLFPLLGAMFLPRWVTPKAGISAALLGPIATLLWHMLLPKAMNPLYPGLAVSMLVLIAVSLMTHAPRARGASAG